MSFIISIGQYGGFNFHRGNFTRDGRVAGANTLIRFGWISLIVLPCDLDLELCNHRQSIKANLEAK